MVGIATALAKRQALRVELGLKDSVYVQFGRFIGKAAQFDFGVSYQHKKPVTDRGYRGQADRVADPDRVAVR
ncbi:MAG: hypothetical protein CFH40_00584 [Alphaproteobacteria bacterium MarineAlpha10_Bin3]|jgi:peptide/nickel transport system permease protein|nr:MAG: hypothetical protein CFH40_00584 [Alphaproteobacteria bacterium MarineAlpha10_Bin3]PPR74542.1 MAG: hypothetical protein CFH09_00584 [Alphaproteobacteria bacterium MarineAlpha4_Bin1]